MYKKIAITSAMLLTLTGCSAVPDTAPHNCINVIVDYANLNPGNYVNECIPATQESPALEILSNANLNIVGTDKYGTQIVCRVNDLPSATKPIGLIDHEDYVEPCKDMPPAFAYWAVLVKDHHGKFDWAKTGVADIKLNPGDSIALVFSPNGETKFPND